MPSIGRQMSKGGEKEKLLPDKTSLDKDDYGTTTEPENKGGRGRRGRGGPKGVSLKQLLFRFADGWDVFLMVAGILVSAITGAGWPFISTIFGGMTNNFVAAQNSFGSGNWTGDTASAVSGRIAGKVTITPVPSVPPELQTTKQAFLDNVAQSSLQYTYLGIVILFTAYVQMACWLTACERQVHRIRKEFFRGILRQNIAWFDEHQSGEMTTKLNDNLERMKEGMGDKVGLLIQFVAQFFAGFIIAFVYSWKLTLVMMSLTPLMAGSAAFMSKLISSSTKREQEKYAKAGAIAEEVLSCIRTVISFNGQDQESDRYKAALDEGKRDGIMKSLYTGGGLAVTFLIIFSSYALAFWYGSVLILANEIPRGTVFTVFFSVMMGSMALGNAAPQISTVAIAKGAAVAVHEIIDRIPKIDPYSKDGKKIQTPKGQIDLVDVRFNYPTRKDVNVLQGVSFTVRPGETIALCGSSGCGKSTIINLLLRYYDIDSGKILIDNEPVNELNVSFLRNLIGVVSQEPVLFETTIEENIKLGKPGISHAEMVRAAKMANAHSFITKLPKGYNTLCGEGGAQLSGGQKQRVAIARALVRDPKILLLDEATSALDAESEGIVQEALDKAAEGRTTVIIAHRLSTIRNADMILAMADGEVVEAGNHADLMSAKGLYYNLVTAQLFEDATSEYASAAEGQSEEKAEDEDSGTDMDSSGKRKRFSRQLSKKRKSIGGTSALSGSYVGSEVSNTSSRRPSRLLGKIQTEEDRLKAELEEENLDKSTFKQIAKENRPEWLYIVLAILGSIVRGFIMPAFAFFYSEIFNVYSKEGEELRKGSIFWSLMFIVIGVINGIATMVSIFFFGLSGELLTSRLRYKVFRNVLRQDVGYFDEPKHSTGKICTRLATDAPNVKGALDFRFAQVVAAFVSLVAGCAIAFIYGWQMALLVLAVLPLLAFGGYLSLKVRSGSQKADAKMLEEAGKTASEAIENIRTVQALTQENTFHTTFSRQIEEPHKMSLKKAHIQAVSYCFSQSVFFFLYAISFWFGGFLVGKNLMMPLDVFRVFFAIAFSGMTLGMATSYFPEFLKARFSAALIFKMIDEEPKIDSYSKAGLRPDITGALHYNDVYFFYPMRTKAMVLNGLSFQLETGKTLALVGASGCGKSTVVKLLERFYDPTDGNIVVDDFDLRTINLHYMRNQIAVVSQEPVLFDCSIEKNIVYGLNDVSHAKVVESAKLANIHEFIMGLPQGYETRVGEKGTQLSGGQKQRVAIARALVRDPKILLLDEATSALDTESEKIVQEALDKAREGRTCIIIAHRLSTVQSADSIAVIKNGQVVEQGSHADLVAKRGAYFNLTKKQNLNQ